MSLFKALRHVPVAVLLGLPTAVLTHHVLFGNSHELGSSAHAGIIDAAFVASALVVIMLLATTVLSARTIEQGSIVAARVRAIVPDLLTLAGAAAAWLGAIESLEARHSFHAALAALALLCIAWLVRTTLSTAARAFAALAVVWFHTPHEPIVVHVQTCLPLVLHVRPPGERRRLFSRPPPVFA